MTCQINPDATWVVGFYNREVPQFNTCIAGIDYSDSIAKCSAMFLAESVHSANSHGSLLSIQVIIERQTIAFGIDTDNLFVNLNARCANHEERAPIGITHSDFRVGEVDA